MVAIWQEVAVGGEAVEGGPAVLAAEQLVGEALAGAQGVLFRLL